MNNLILTTLFALVLAAAEEGHKEKAVSAFMKCSKENKISSDEIAAYKSGDRVPKSKEAKCLMACMMREGKVIEGSQYNKENALRAIDLMVKDNPEAADKAKQIIETCVKEVGTDVGPDECEYAFKFISCNEAQAVKMGIKRST